MERDRSERVRGHAFHFALIVNGNERDSGGETTHGAAEFVLSGAHGLNQICTTNTGFPVRRRFPL